MRWSSPLFWGEIGSRRVSAHRVLVEGPAFSPRLLNDSDVLDDHLLVRALGHVVEGEAGNTYGGPKSRAEGFYQLEADELWRLPDR